MSEAGDIRARGEEALGEIARAMFENPLFGDALGKALSVSERAASAQRAALGALDLSSAGDVERLNRRVRALSERLEALEDELDRAQRELRDTRADEVKAVRSTDRD